MNFIFTPLAGKDNDAQEVEVDVLYTRLTDPKIQVKLIKYRDKYCCFSALSNYETQMDEILHNIFKKYKNPKAVQKTYLITPTKKTLEIQKMLNNQVLIEPSNTPLQWSGYNLEYTERVELIDISIFFKYLWCDQLLNYTGTGIHFCKHKLQKYVKYVLSTIECSSSSYRTNIESIVEFVRTRYVNDLNSIISLNLNEFLSNFDMNSMFRLFLEWHMTLGIVPFFERKHNETLDVQDIHSMFSSETLQPLLTIQNEIPPMSDVSVILIDDKIECWHLPSKKKSTTWELVK